MNATNRISIPEVVERFAAYYQKQGCGWGSLHLVLANDNCKDSSAEFCIGWAKERGDVEGEELAKLLLQMTPSQRGRLHGKVNEFLKESVLS